MQPARIKPHAKEHTNNPVQRPHFRGQGATKLRDNEMEALKRFPTKGPRKNDATLKAVRGECRRHPPRPRGQERGAGRGTRVWKGSRQQAVVSTSRGVSLFSERTHPFTGEPIPRSISTSLGGSLFSDWTNPFTGGPIPRSSTSFRRTRWQDLTSVVGLGISQGTSPVERRPQWRRLCERPNADAGSGCVAVYW